jgi:hypothetical protein
MVTDESLGAPVVRSVPQRRRPLSVALAVPVVVLFVLYTAAIIGSRAAAFIPDHEFTGYRYFGSLSILNHELVTIPPVQRAPQR